LAQILLLPELLMDEETVEEWYLEEGIGPYSECIGRQGGILFWNTNCDLAIGLKAQTVQNNTAQINGIVTKIGIQTAVSTGLLGASLATNGLSDCFMICSVLSLLAVIIGFIGLRVQFHIRMPDLSDTGVDRRELVQYRSSVETKLYVTLYTQDVVMARLMRLMNIQLAVTILSVLPMVWWVIVRVGNP